MKSGATPLVSVLLPIHDAEQTLSSCLASIRRQRETRWECVAVDDGSTDGSAAQIRELARRDDRFRVVTTPHRGLVAALNTGLDQCRGRFIARMDADDLMHRFRLRDQVRMLEADAALGAVGCRVRLFPRKRLGPGYRDYEKWINGIDSPERLRREAFIECPVAHPSLVFRSDCILRLGYRDRGWPEDYDLVLRMVTRGLPIDVLPQRRLAWRHRTDRLSRTAEAYSPKRFTECKAFFLAGSFLGGHDRYILWGYGGTGRALRRALDGLGKRPSHIVELHPGRLGNRIHGAPVVSPSCLPRLARRPIVVSVAGEGPRLQIRSALAAMGFSETRDFVCAA